MLFPKFPIGIMCYFYLKTKILSLVWLPLLKSKIAKNPPPENKFVKIKSFFIVIYFFVHTNSRDDLRGISEALQERNYCAGGRDFSVANFWMSM